MLHQQFESCYLSVLVGGSEGEMWSPSEQYLQVSEWVEDGRGGQRYHGGWRGDLRGDNEHKMHAAEYNVVYSRESLPRKHPWEQMGVFKG